MRFRGENEGVRKTQNYLCRSEAVDEGKTSHCWGFQTREGKLTSACMTTPMDSNGCLELGVEKYYEAI